MKTELNIEESDRLIELGVDAKLASGESLVGGALFSLTDLLSILPKATRDLGGIIFGFAVERGTWVAEYDDCPDSCKYGEELIDALNSLLIWAIENNYVNLNTINNEK